MLTQFQQLLLDRIARDEETEATANRICLHAEDVSRGTLCSMLTVDRAGHLHPLAGPSLSAEYAAQLDGIAIGPEVGSCGSAVYLRKPVIVTDIFTDPRWARYRSLAEPLGVRACWSSPILSGDGRSLGAFGFYFRDERGPTAAEESLVAECLGLSTILLDRREARLDNLRLTYVDAMSGLGNRAAFERAMADAVAAPGRLGLLLLDIGHLKTINADLGYAAGDMLIREIGLRLRSETRAGRAFRLGAGEFAILQLPQDIPQDLSRLAAGMLATLRTPALCGSYFMSPIVSCGGAVLDRFEPRDPELLRRKADRALEHARTNARGRFVAFEEGQAVASQHRVQVMQVTHALRDYRIEAHYQPVVRLDTQEIVGLEALCRMRMPDGTLVPAAQMVAGLNDGATASLVTDRMLDLLARDLRGWLDEGARLHFVSLNVGMADFRRGDLQQRVTRVLARYDLSPRQLLIEVTEQVNFDDYGSYVKDAVARLRAAGFRVALDDFGTGYASLAQLLATPIDVIKTDRSLMQGFRAGTAGEIFVKALLEMAQGLGAELVVEGVETGLQAAQLQALGCPLAQGYFFSKPADVETINEMLLGPRKRAAIQ